METTGFIAQRTSNCIDFDLFLSARFKKGDFVRFGQYDFDFVKGALFRNIFCEITNGDPEVYQKIEINDKSLLKAGFTKSFNSGLEPTYNISTADNNIIMFVYNFSNWKCFFNKEWRTIK